MKTAVIIFPGSNCDHDIYYAFKKVLGAQTDFIWHKESNLSSYDLVVLPGGFSYGDYLRSGAIARFSPVMKEVVKHAEKGGYVVGICNGFQILTESHLLPGALHKNVHRKFVCRDVYLRVENNRSVFTGLCREREVLSIPIAHGDGNYYCDEDTLRELEENAQILFRYSNEKGETDRRFNPNGSVANIAGVINKSGNVLGMMPHPERRVESLLKHDDGLKILKSLVNGISGN